VNWSASSGLFAGATAWTKPFPQADIPAPAGAAEDEALMVQVQAGDEVALGLLLDRYARLVLGIGCRILRDPGEAQELVQDVFLHAYRKAALFDPHKGAFRSWLIRIACHRALDRREYLNLHRFYDDRNLDDYVDVFRASTNPELEADLSLCEKILRKAFEELTHKQRLTVEMYFFEGYTLREISERLNESLANTRHYYYRALEHLKKSVHLNSLKKSHDAI
jgi:RNA polymerase sigma-70 factor (ECF subfamily)